MIKEYLSSKYLAEAVEEFAKLPSIGEKTALRLVLHLLNKDKEQTQKFIESIDKLINNVKYCKICNNISDEEICPICQDTTRDHSTICVVENIKDIIAIEKTHQYNGVYHVLGGLISPIDGITPEKLSINQLLERIEKNQTKEIILALNTTMEGETTSFYIYKKIKKYNIPITTIARGIGFGDELEYTDELTLGKAISNRIEYKED